MILQTYAFLSCVIWIILCGHITCAAFNETQCPVCFRVVKASKSLGESTNTKPSISFEKYCALASLPVDEMKFCYDIDSFKRDLMKLFDFGADEGRICKRVFKENPNFCAIKKKAVDLPGTRDRKNARGIILE